MHPTFVNQMSRPEGAPHETDLQRWHLEVNEGQQVWRFDAAGKRVQTVVDRYFLGLPTVSSPPGAQCSDSLPWML
jgi:hypothetical protein